MSEDKVLYVKDGSGECFKYRHLLPLYVSDPERKLNLAKNKEVENHTFRCGSCMDEVHK